MKQLSAKNWSHLFDFFIITADFFIGTLLARWFMPFLSDQTGSSRTAGTILCVTALIVCVLYCAGLWINRVNFRAEPSLKMSSGDFIALMFNSVLLSSIFIVVLIELFPALSYMWLVIVLVFAFMGFWFWLHWYILKKVSSDNGGTPSLSRKIAGFFMVFPFVILLSLSISALAEEMRFQGEQAITWNSALWSPLMIGLLLALCAWFMFYIPRKFLKGFAGVNISSKAFFGALVLEYAFKISPANFL